MEIGVISRKIKVRALSDALEKYCLLYMFCIPQVNNSMIISLILYLKLYLSAIITVNTFLFSKNHFTELFTDTMETN